MATAAQVLAELAALAGENEAVLGSNNTTVNKYFNAVGAAYCGYSLMYACKKAGSTVLDKCANAAYVPTLKSFLVDQGWKVASNADAQAGDIFIYNQAHTGFVYAPYSGTTVITLEGNSTVYDTLAKAKASTSGTGAYEGIGYKKRTLNSAYTIYRPPYDGTGSSSSSSTTSSTNYIKTFQTWLNTNYKTGLSVDGIYGSLTKKAAIKAWQTSMNAAHGTGLVVDGIFGTLSRAAATKYPIKSGATGALVYILQGMLYCKGYDPNGFDGIFGSGCKAAVVAFQKANSLTQDGEAGVSTFTKLFS